MNAKISVFVICVEATIYLLLYDLHDCTFKAEPLKLFKNINLFKISYASTLYDR